MNVLTKFKWFLWYFGHFKVPLIGHVRPKLIELTDEKILIKIALTRRTKNHLSSLYFGALAIGADIAGGLHGFYYSKKFKEPISLVFKSMQAQFIKRPESDVFFLSESGELIARMITESSRRKERVSQLLPVKAYTNYPLQPELVAEFMVELSIKVLK